MGERKKEKKKKMAGCAAGWEKQKRGKKKMGDKHEPWTRRIFFKKIIILVLVTFLFQNVTNSATLLKLKRY